MKAFKGFNPDMTCRGFKYEKGKTYKEDKASLCNSGFHACEDAIDVFGYYPPCNEEGVLNKFHEVELEGVSDEKSDDDSKVCATEIKIGADLNFFGIAKAHVEYVKSKIEKSKEESNTGNRSAATNTGDQSAATNTGNWSAATNTGNQSAATNTGKDSIALAWGIESKAKAAKGSYIALAEWVWNENECAYVLKCAKMKKVDGKVIKADTFYTLKAGKFVEAE